MTNPAQQYDSYTYSVKDIKERLAEACCTLRDTLYNGSPEIFLQTMEQIVHGFGAMGYQEVKQSNASGYYADGLFECLWLLKKHGEDFGTDAPVRLPRPVEDYFAGQTPPASGLSGDLPDVTPLAAALKTFYDGETAAKQAQEKSAAQDRRNAAQNIRRSNLRQFIKKPPGAGQ